MILMQSNVLKSTSWMSHAICSAGCVEQLIASFSIALGSSGETEDKCGSGQDSCLWMEMCVEGRRG